MEHFELEFIILIHSLQDCFQVWKQKTPEYFFMHLPCQTFMHASEQENRERETSTENDAESNPVVNVANTIAENAIRKLCNRVTKCIHQDINHQLQIVTAKSSITRETYSS